MLLRTTLLMHKQQANCLVQLRTVSIKASHPATAKAAKTNGRKLVDSNSSITSSTSNSVNTSSGSGQLRNRKLTPAAKAKAQASASRALKEQLAAMGIKDGSTSSSDIDIAKRQQSEKESLSSSSTSVLSSSRKFNDAIAYATAESYDFKKLIGSERLPAGWQMLEDDEVLYIPHWPHPSTSSTLTASSISSSPSGGEVFIFQSGSYVTWGLSSDQSSRFLKSVLQGRAGVGGKGQSAEVDKYTTIGDEAMEYILAEDQITRVVGDVIVIGQAPRIVPDEQFDPEFVEEQDGSTEDSADWSPLLARLAFSQGLSRSARLSVQEAALSDYLEEVASLPGRLELEGKVPLHRKEVIRKMGTLLKLRQRANLDSENFLDDPEMYWENWKVEHHYDSICLALDIESRFKAYNEKLDHGENLLGVLRALLTESSTHRMELIIIYLIAFEVILALISHGYVPSPKGIWNLINGRGLHIETDDPVESAHGEFTQSDQKLLSIIRRVLPRDASTTSIYSSSSTRLV